MAADGGFTFTPAADWNGSVPTVTYTTDTGATGSLDITVTPVDDPTRAAPDVAVAVPLPEVCDPTVVHTNPVAPMPSAPTPRAPIVRACRRVIPPLMRR